MDIRPFLEDLERRISPAVEDQLLDDWRTFAHGGYQGDLFSPRRATTSEPGIAWPAVRVNQALDDYEHMLLQQLAGCSGALAKGTGAVLNVRCNYGSSILPSLFGVKLFIMDDCYNTLPTSEPIEGGTDGIRRLIDQGIPSLTAGYGEQVMEMGQRYLAAFADYPNVSKYVKIYHPDMQGPMDVCELLWGSGIFLEFFDNAELVHRLLDLVCDTYTAFRKRWLEIVPAEGDTDTHWSMMHRGHIMLRDDSAMNLSPEMFAEFIAPYNQRLLREFGGGADHFCGRGDHYMEQLTALDGLYAINMSQPEYNDMETIYRHTVDKGVPIIGLARTEADRALAAGRDLHGLVHSA
jgi:hypothetical protein